ncbi:kinase-like domain-containing protein [Melanogaster broomeanus]|nr:kinase-like domain-containing protein [Melanogaster broomeanus]
MNEIGLLKRLEGNNRIIQLFDSEVKAGPGGGKGHLMLLLQEQQKESLNMVWISYYWQQMLQAVHVIHEEKIVHSDLKPANFVLVRGQLKLIDFGIANAIANDTTNIQRDHQIGTVNYMSPEAIELPDGMRRLKVGRPSDVWSLGCILYQMKMKAIPDLAHVIEFPEHSVPSVVNKNGERKKLDHLKRPVRADVIRGMRSCLARHPKERATIPELLEQEWLAMREPEIPPAKALLAGDETIINPYYMKQLLEYGIKLGQQAQAGDIDPVHLAKEAEVCTIYCFSRRRLVAELKALES